GHRIREHAETLDCRLAVLHDERTAVAREAHQRPVVPDELRIRLVGARAEDDRRERREVGLCQACRIELGDVEPELLEHRQHVVADAAHVADFELGVRGGNGFDAHGRRPIIAERANVLVLDRHVAFGEPFTLARRHGRDRVAARLHRAANMVRSNGRFASAYSTSCCKRTVIPGTVASGRSTSPRARSAKRRMIGPAATVTLVPSIVSTTRTSDSPSRSSPRMSEGSTPPATLMLNMSPTSGRVSHQDCVGSGKALYDSPTRAALSGSIVRMGLDTTACAPPDATKSRRTGAVPSLCTATVTVIVSDSATT